ncbi:hybrid sensor histidine kinase/response regulator [Ottowia sp.]|uniref:ATP-binding response regulator n=1 Tax=Ottowia sp. TaxID=1898956 RepID=UPI00263205CE|nr:hybrid sensor histidine kinase/response regulator [Ottowia sp.]
MIERPTTSSERGLTQPAPMVLLTRACELLAALLFMLVMPIWQPLLWFALVSTAGTWAFVRVRQSAFKKLPERERRDRYRRYIWQSAAAVGSAAWLLYVPGSHGLQALLAMYLASAAGLVAMWGVRDVPRTAMAVTLILGPTVVRFMVEGATDRRPMLLLFGACGPILIALIVYTTALYARRLTQEAELRAQAEQATDAMAAMSLAKSRFFAAVSHDLRQPVHAIGLYLEPLAQALGQHPDAAARRALNGVRQSWQALDGLLSQVLDLTRMDSGAMRACLAPVDALSVVRATVAQHGAVAERAGVRVLVRLHTGPMRWVMADELMLRRVLSNLLDNAIKFSPAGGNVMIAVRPAAQAWRIQVRDAGPGVPNDQQVCVFNEFVQLDNLARDRQHGYGLGLAISRRFAQAMLGELALRSAPGRGSCFTLTLPRAEAEHSTVHVPDDDPDSAPMPLTTSALAARDILLVEDDPLVRDAMGELLRSWGQRVRRADTAAQAWACRGFGEIAICDVRLPGGASGLELALSLRALGKQVLLISGESDAVLRRQAAAVNLPLLIKPVSATRLRSALQSI